MISVLLHDNWPVTRLSTGGSILFFAFERHKHRASNPGQSTGKSSSASPCAWGAVERIVGARVWTRFGVLVWGTGDPYQINYHELNPYIHKMTALPGLKFYPFHNDIFKFGISANKQEFWNRKLSWIFVVNQTWKLCGTVKNGFLDPENTFHVVDRILCNR